MNRLSTLSITVLVIAALLVSGASLAAAEDGDDSAESEEFEDLSIGEQISSVVSAQEAEVTSELDRHAFGHAVANADSDEERAEIIAQRMEKLNSELEESTSEKEELREQYQSGEISRAEYVSELSAKGVEAAEMQEDADEVEEAAGGLPVETLEENGVNTDALNTLRENAANMAGPEVASVAQTIAGGEPPVDIPGKGESRPDDAGGDNKSSTDDDTSGTGADGDQRPDDSDQRPDGTQPEPDNNGQAGR